MRYDGMTDELTSKPPLQSDKFSFIVDSRQIRKFSSHVFSIGKQKHIGVIHVVTNHELTQVLFNIDQKRFLSNYAQDVFTGSLLHSLYCF